MIIDLVHLFFYVVYLIIIADVILSFVEIGLGRPRWMYNPVINFIRQTAFQILRPFRKFLDRFPGLRTLPIDFSPLVAILALNLLEPIVIQLLRAIGLR